MSGITLQAKTVTIRKPRSCRFCGDKFQPGDKMHYLVGTQDGDFFAAYDCLTCHDYIHENWEYLVEDGEVSEFVGERHYKDFKANRNG